MARFLEGFLTLIVILINLRNFFLKTAYVIDSMVQLSLSSIISHEKDVS